MRILFAGGGTGGHITPIIAIARELKQIYKPELETSLSDRQEGLRMYFLGAKGPGGLDNVLEGEGIKVKIISAGKFRRYFSLKTFTDLFKVPWSLLQVFWQLFVWMPDVIFSKGGYGSVPVVIVGWLYRIPIITHESDAIPGLATRLGGKLSKRIAVSFSRAEDFFPQGKTALIGSPVRLEVVQACTSLSQADKETARKIFQIASQNPTILVLGGSQGAQQIDQIILSILPQLFGKYEIIHQCRSEDYENIKRQTETAQNYHLYPFLDENQMKAAFLLADLVISRAGATTIFEIAACNKPSILIPLSEAAFDHQRENAFAYAKSGATSIIEQVNLTPNILLSEISQIIDSPELAKKMGEGAKNFSRLEAGQLIAQELIELALE